MRKIPLILLIEFCEALERLERDQGGVFKEVLGYLGGFRGSLA